MAQPILRWRHQCLLSIKIGESWWSNINRSLYGMCLNPRPKYLSSDRKNIFCSRSTLMSSSAHRFGCRIMNFEWLFWFFLLCLPVENNNYSIFKIRYVQFFQFWQLSFHQFHLISLYQFHFIKIYQIKKKNWKCSNITQHQQHQNINYKYQLYGSCDQKSLQPVQNGKLPF